MFLEIILLGLCACLYVWIFRPELILYSTLRIKVLLAGLKTKEFTTNDFKWSYFERGQQEKKVTTMVLLHGFSLRAAQWADMCKFLPRDLHIIAPDLPGHGNTDRIPLPEDAIGALIDKVREFIRVMGLENQPIHLVGLSMGGSIAMCYAAAYPDHVKGVSLLGPALKTPTPSKMVEQLREGMVGCLIDFTEDGIRRRVSMATFNSPKLPGQMVKGLKRFGEKYEDFFAALHENVIKTLHTERITQESRRVKSPSQVIWGEQDELVHPSGVSVLRNTLPNLKDVQMLPRCGHMIPLEYPQELADLVMAFREKHVQKEGILKSFKKKAVSGVANVGEILAEEQSG